MSYRLVQFDGLAVSEYIQRGDTQDIASGSAMTAFLSLPGGGYYDNFGTKVRPQNIQTPHKRGVLIGTASELHAQLQAWRAKIGKRGKLTAEWDDGALRWKWAVLQDVSAPRPSEAKGGWLPIDLTWVTGMSGWRGPLHGDAAWVWGDGSWTWGDGSAEFGDGSDYTFTLPDSDHVVTITNDGDVDAGYVVLRLNTTGSWTDVTIINQTTGQQIVVDRAGSGTEDVIEVNTGARTIYTALTAIDVTSIARSQNTLTVTATAHGLTTDDTVRLEGTGTYDGDYYPVTVSSSSVFTVPVAPDFAGYGTVTDGTLQELTSLYDLTTFSDRKRWLTLVPGDNSIRVIWAPFPSSASLEVAYYDLYA